MNTVKMQIYLVTVTINMYRSGDKDLRIFSIGNRQTRLVSFKFPPLYPMNYLDSRCRQETPGRPGHNSGENNIRTHVGN